MNTKSKPEYDAPMMIPLGALAYGSGDCKTGSVANLPQCNTGTGGGAPADCRFGGVAKGSGACTTGGIFANRNCHSGAAV